jgi:chemotaxis protein CheY-P-specific phosphatase CheC
VHEDDDEEEDYEDDDEGEYESSDIILEAVEEIAKIFAVAIASAIKEAMEKGPDEPK